MQGDSGSPLWQFQNGRAVLIGIMATGYPYFNGTHFDKCDDPNRVPGFTTFMRVSLFIDWIKNVTQLK